MAGMTTNRPIGTVRGKSKAIRSRKPRKRGNKLNEPTWQE